jgi:uncharacterized protein (TIGR00369 family)
MNWLALFQEHTRGLFPALLGVRFVEVTADVLRAEMAVRDDLCTVPGVMHGGALMAFADTLGACATAMRLPKGSQTTTIESKTNFLAAATAGTTVTGECVVLHHGRRTCVCQTRIVGSDGRLLALVTQTQAILEARPDPVQQLASLFTGRPPAEQRALLAQLERAGAALYRDLAAAEPDAGKRDALLAAADREDENAIVLERW